MTTTKYHLNRRAETPDGTGYDYATALDNVRLQVAQKSEELRRLRPIVMTTSTTVLGVLPLAFVLGAWDEIQAALARAVIGGLAASTFFTLVFIPVAWGAVYNLLARRRA